MEELELKQKIAEITGSVEEIIAEINTIPDKEEFNDAPLEFRSKLKDLANDLNNCKLRFGAKKYFVVCLGAVKAGKSTLLNALAEKWVSPDGSGIETTKHCSIILSADAEHPEGITVYRTIRKEKDDKYIANLLDYFQNIKKWESLKNDFEKSRLFALNYLEEILTKEKSDLLQNFHDFCLAEIRVNVSDSSILKKDVAFIDMPGLDGVIAGVKAQPIIEEIPQQCQHLLWVQSTVSALNCTTYENLKNFTANKSTEIPVYCILNQMKAKSEWHKKDAVDQDCDSQVKKLWDKLPQSGNRKSSTFVVNAAMAWDWCNYDQVSNKLKSEFSRERLLEESKIEVLKNSIYEKVKDKKSAILLEDALHKLDSLCCRLHSADNPQKHDIIEYKGQTDQALENARKDKRNVEECKSKYDMLFKSISEKYKNEIQREINDKFTDKLEALKNTIDEVMVNEVVPGNLGDNIDKATYEKLLRDWIISRDKKFKENIRSVFLEFFNEIHVVITNKFGSFKNDLNGDIVGAGYKSEFFETYIEKSIIDKDRVIEILKHDIFHSEQDKDSSIKSLDSMEKFYENKKIDIPTGRWVQKAKFRNYDRNPKEITDYADDTLLKPYKNHLKDQLEESIRSILKYSSKNAFDEKSSEIDQDIQKYLRNKIKELGDTISLNEKIIDAIEKIQDDVKREIKKKCEILTDNLRRK